jgi:hypothetical protein
VHGNFALANSADGLWCGVDSEMKVLAETGCYADFTLPTAPLHAAQTAKINSLYECGLPLEQAAPHRTGTDLSAGRSPRIFPLMVQGPLLVDFGRSRRALRPQLETGAITPRNPMSLHRLALWKQARIRVAGRPDWLFIKLHCHSMDPKHVWNCWSGQRNAGEQHHEALVRHMCDQIVSRSRRRGHLRRRWRRPRHAPPPSSIFPAAISRSSTKIAAPGSSTTANLQFSRAAPRARKPRPSLLHQDRYRSHHPSLRRDGRRLRHETARHVRARHLRQDEAQADLARDRLGKKPLHYALHNGNLYFASEIKAILAVAPELAEVNSQGLLEYLYYGYVPDPITAFTGIHKLPPDTCWNSRTARFSIRQYWDLPGYNTHSFPAAKKSVWKNWSIACFEATKIRLISDVPLGAFLSGGTDSSTVVALMARASSGPVKTFSIGFKKDDFNEAEYARMVAASSAPIITR